MVASSCGRESRRPETHSTDDAKATAPRVSGVPATARTSASPVCPIPASSRAAASRAAAAARCAGSPGEPGEIGEALRHADRTNLDRPRDLEAAVASDRALGAPAADVEDRAAGAVARRTRGCAPKTARRFLVAT